LGKVYGQNYLVLTVRILTVPLKKTELTPVKIVFPSCTSVEISEKMDISMHTVQALELAKTK